MRTTSPRIYKNTLFDISILNFTMVRLLGSTSELLRKSRSICLGIGLPMRTTGNSTQKRDPAVLHKTQRKKTRAHTQAKKKQASSENETTGRNKQPRYSTNRNMQTTIAETQSRKETNAHKHNQNSTTPRPCQGNPCV